MVANQAKWHAEPTAALGAPPADANDAGAEADNAAVDGGGNNVGDENIHPSKEDYLDMHFASIADCMRKRMSVDQQDDLLLEIDQLVNDAFCQLKRGTAAGTSKVTRNEMADVTMGVQLMGSNQMVQQFLAPNNPQSSNEMFGPQALNHPQFQGFSSYLQLN